MKTNLYRVTLRGLTNQVLGSEHIHGISYVVARNSDDAYKAVCDELDRRGIGFSWERCLDKVELVASTRHDSQYALRIVDYKE